MAYQSVHSGPAIDAAVTQLADIQEVRVESNANLAAVQNLAAQVATDAGTASTAAASATQTLNGATAAIAAADHARQEQIDAEIAIVADQRFAAEQAAAEAVAAADAAVVTVTQDMAASVPTPNKLPLANALGKIASDWLGADIARGDALSAADGAGLVGFQQSGAGAVARTMQDKARDAVSIKDFGAKFDYTGTSGSDDSAAWAAAIEWAKEHYPKTLRIDDGFSLCNSAWPVIDRPVSIVGSGRSYVCFSSVVTGQCVTVRNTGFNDEVGYLSKAGNAAFTDSSEVIAGTELCGFWLLGNRAAPTKQHGIVFEGNCDFSRINLDIGYFSGCGFWAGKQDQNGVRGNLRENSELNIRARSCGNADGTPSILFELTDSSQPADSSNLCKSINLECVFPYGKGVAFIDSRTVSSGSPMYGFSGSIMVHGWQGGALNNGALLHFEGDVQLMDFEVNVAFNRGQEADIVFLRNAATSAVPRDIRLRSRHPNSLYAYRIDRGVNIQLDLLYAFTRKETLTIGSAFEGPLLIDSNSSAQFISYPASIQLSGTTPINLSAWNGAFSSVSAMPSFMPIINANGTGDAMRVAIAGVAGVITRSGSTANGTDAYTFTPDTASSSFIGAKTHFSKFVIPSSFYNSVSGRYDFPTSPRGGVSTSSSWDSDRLMRFSSWHMWVQGASPLLRYISGPPTSDDSGRALAVISKAYVGASATPGVTARSLLLANYASPTTMTNMTGGVDGQVVTIIATNGNCTIANNTTIATKSGASTVLAAGSAAQFIYSSDIGKWVQMQ